ncbi:hypothetical protein [Undibacterium terreum]|uniref:Uncharacterized protein n=1 Tax=Undibacterium terreum TaxID=1224302 RepID=A0A916UPG9_9BURK|nr:hypothetical protein [Undibacterium terreum]GGC78631.1 hypothetical protein GCM10011396_27270 [Undibacterium terreum]
MYLDHPRISATRSETEPDRIERLNRVYGYAIALADVDGNTECITKLSKIHDHKGILMVIWFAEPTEKEKAYFSKAWMSKIGDLSSRVEHEVLQKENLSTDS